MDANITVQEEYVASGQLSSKVDCSCRVKRTRGSKCKIGDDNLGLAAFKGDLHREGSGGGQYSKVECNRGTM